MNCSNERIKWNLSKQREKGTEHSKVKPLESKRVTWSANILIKQRIQNFSQDHQKPIIKVVINLHRKMLIPF